jgi:hypothetical protein
MNFTSPFRKTILFLALLVLVATAAAETNTIQLYVHPGSGTVCVDSTCQVDRGTISGSSSTYFAGVASGQQHTIRIYGTDGYQDYTDQVYMDQSGDHMSFTIYLEPVPVQTAAPDTGTIQVTVSPGLGQVCLDSKECESSTGETSTYWSVQFSDVPAVATHTITVTADGYQTYTQQVSIQPDQRNDVDITLQPLQQATAPAEQAQQSVPPAAPRSTKSPVAIFTIIAAVGICGAPHLIRKKN